ncbi:hypothetical protein ABZ863_03295 [Saccharomonospora sp. NPDC046836]|uniref:hypothetical protein n=1 Tax=Saccharomonospora sp. NPDC046836 TaxID=3156921 RepID=UPI0033F45FC6
MTTSPLLAPPVEHAWSAQERSVLVRAALNANPCGVGNPWTLEIQGHRAELYERFGATSWHHDGTGRDRVIACGTALASVVVAVRVLGWVPEITLLGDPSHPDLVATVTARARHRPSSADVRRFQAIFDRTRHRDTHDPGDFPEEMLADIMAAGTRPGVRLLALSAFTPANRKQTLDPGLLVVTTSDGRRDQVLAGAAMQEASLAARAYGLTSSPQISPFQFREFRQRIVRSRRVRGSPQLLLRLGRRQPVEGTEPW